jgi:hypothetical protein
MAEVNAPRLQSLLDTLDDWERVAALWGDLRDLVSNYECNERLIASKTIPEDELREVQERRRGAVERARDIHRRLDEHVPDVAEYLDAQGIETGYLLGFAQLPRRDWLPPLRLTLQQAKVRAARAAAESPPNPPQPVARLQIQGATVLLDGSPVPLDMTEESRGAAICLLTHLLAAAGDWRSGSELNAMEVAGPCKQHVDVRWDLVRKQLPPALLSLTETNRRKGTRLRPDALRR